MLWLVLNFLKRCINLFVKIVGEMQCTSLPLPRKINIFVKGHVSAAVGVGVAAGVIGLGMALVLGYRAARWIKSKYRWWMAPAGAAAAGYVIIIIVTYDTGICYNSEVCVL